MGRNKDLKNYADVYLNEGLKKLNESYFSLNEDFFTGAIDNNRKVAKLFQNKVGKVLESLLKVGFDYESIGYALTTNKDLSNIRAFLRDGDYKGTKIEPLSKLIKLEDKFYRNKKESNRKPLTDFLDGGEFNLYKKADPVSLYENIVIEELKKEAGKYEILNRANRTKIIEKFSDLWPSFKEPSVKKALNGYLSEIASREKGNASFYKALKSKLFRDGRKKYEEIIRRSLSSPEDRSAKFKKIIEENHDIVESLRNNLKAPPPSTKKNSIGKNRFDKRGRGI